MDRFDAIRQEGKRHYADSLRSQAHDRRTANGNLEESGRLAGNSREIVQ